MSTHEVLMAKADAAIASTDNIVRISQLMTKVQILENTIKDMKRIMRDNDVTCSCGEELSWSELEYGYCDPCARHLS